MDTSKGPGGHVELPECVVVNGRKFASPCFIPDAATQNLPALDDASILIAANRVMDDLIAANSDGNGYSVSNAEPFAWWDKLSQQEQNAIDARTEDYRDHRDYWRREIFSKANREELARYTNLEFGELQRQAIDRVVRSLIADPKMRADKKYARRRLGVAASLIRGYLLLTFDVPPDAHRPIVNEERHRRWSKLMFLGKTAKAIVEEEDPFGESLSETAIGKLVRDHRRRRLGRDSSSVQWQLRSSIYWAEFAKPKS